jgi:hypothetical protein
MADGTQDMAALAIGVDGVAQGLAVKREALVVGTEIGVPALPRAVQRGGIGALGTSERP